MPKALPCIRAPQHTPLAASVIALFALAAPEARAVAVTWHVNTCAEGISGDLATRTGTLRFALANAAPAMNGNPDTILFALPAACHSTISLTTGALAVPQDFLNVIGPSARRVTITAQGSPVKDRVVTHNGNGTLTLKNVNLEYGQATTEASELGGCLYSKASVSMDNVGVYGCMAKSATIGGTAYGGGVFTARDLRLNYSTLAGNSTAAVTATSSGGGAYVRGYLRSSYSTIMDNSADGAYGRGGGIYASGHGANIAATTISGNTARRDFGGVALRGAIGTTITNSTISGNTAKEGIVGGLYASAPLTLLNSTIAFNSAALGTHVSRYAAPGLALAAPTGTLTANLKNTLISNNTYLKSGNEIENDFSTAGAVDLGGSGNNLFYAATGLALGGIATTGACPLLGSLRDNGGQTWTHQLLSRSPAINAGDNSAALALSWDQRGPTYGRHSGTAALTDIGAYELQQSDIVFNAAFDGCP